MDQAAQLRELVNKKRINQSVNVNVVSVVSGKGGVGKTTLVRDLYNSMSNSYIVDADVNAPFFWLYDKTFNCCEGFETFNGRTIVKPVDKTREFTRYDNIIIDAGTGINEINKYFIQKSKLTVFVTNEEEISILNTMNLMKKVSGKKVLYMPGVSDDVIDEMQLKINRYAKSYLDGSVVIVTNLADDIINALNVSR